MNDRIAVITGAASGIGLAVARRFAREGMRLALADVDADGLDAVAAELIEGGTKVLTRVTDVSKAVEVEALAEATVAEFGGLHLAFNNAGVATGGLMWDQTESDWDWVVGVNLYGVVHGIRSFVPRIIASGGGHVVNTASIAGLTSVPFMGPYLATKHAVVGLSEGLHLELQMTHPEVGVSVLCPSWVRTGISRSDRNRPVELGGAGGSEPTPEAAGFREIVDGFISGGLDPAEVADVVLDGIRSRRFYLLTHPEVTPEVEARVQRIVNDGSPAAPNM